VIASFFGLVQIITALILARVLVVFVGQITGLLIMRRYRREIKLPFKMWLYPLPAILALIGWFYVFVSPLTQPGGWRFMLYAFGTIIAGLAAYLALAAQKGNWPFTART
jgi:amino acid transporter